MFLRAGQANQRGRQILSSSAALPEARSPLTEQPSLASNRSLSSLVGQVPKNWKGWGYYPITAAVALYLVAATGELEWLILVALLSTLPLVGSQYRRAARIRRFEQDYPAFLHSVATGVRTGLDPIAAIKSSISLLPPGSPLSEVVNEFLEAMRQGVSEAIAIDRIGDGIGHPDLSLLRSALRLAREEGSSISTCLCRLARVTQQRQVFRRKVRTALALQRLSARAIVLCTLLIALVQYSVNRDALQMALSHPVGQKCIWFGVLSTVLGMVWIQTLSLRRVV